MTMPWRLFGDEFAPLNKHLPARETYVARSVLDVGPKTAPWLEVEGRIYTAFDQDQERHRRHVEQSNSEHIIARLGGPDAKRALVRITSHLGDERREALLAVIRAAGEFLVDRRQEALWKLLYLQLREMHESAICDVMMCALSVDAYEEHDELRFLWGKGWRHRWASELESREEAAAERAALEVATPADDEDDEDATEPA